MSDELIELLGSCGFSYRCIAKHALKALLTPENSRHIAKVLKAAGVRLWDYRHGETPRAKHTLTALKQKPAKRRFG